MPGGGNAIRGSRIGSGPVGEEARGEAAPRQTVTFHCSRGHRSTLAFSVEATPPTEWDCPKCGMPASVDADNPPPPPTTEVYKTHLAYVKERRSEEEGAALLDEAVQSLRSRRKAGEILF
ncbi:RNA polymerase-binding protein RbpA [Nocardioides panacisoli]|uniref:RNA polymerase-binding protein RbpA n=1 Tax=Nocardioides panacisoli TaxID=627624 RepID=UPI001C625E0F|nr:RNA polymerase-binding protein RbpA [Nocardioides panacisoli]QYJ04969.1 RNA polymerase-binding protein RbpA [Nocardioides panacisoli]